MHVISTVTDPVVSVVVCVGRVTWCACWARLATRTLRTRCCCSSTTCRTTSSPTPCSSVCPSCPGSSRRRYGLLPSVHQFRNSRDNRTVCTGNLTNTTLVFRCLKWSKVFSLSSDDNFAFQDEKRRVDLRHVDICSVDPPGCTDIDDALHCKSLPNGNFEVGFGMYQSGTK